MIIKRDSDGSVNISHLFANERIGFNNTSRRYETLEKSFELSAAQTLHSGVYFNGPHVQELEEGLIELTGYKHVIATSNGTMSLYLMAKYMRQFYQTARITPYSFKASFNALRHAGFELSHTDLDEHLMARPTRELREGELDVQVGIFGKQPVVSASPHVIIDACQHWIGMAPTHSAAVSFDPTKNIASLGNGGAVFTNDDDLAWFIRKSINHDETVDGLNARMTELEALYILFQLGHLDDWQHRRLKIARYYNQFFKDSLFDDSPNHNVQKYAIKVKGRVDELIRDIDRHLNIECKMMYPETGKNVIALPLYPELTNEEIQRVTRISELIGLREACI